MEKNMGITFNKWHLVFGAVFVGFLAAVFGSNVENAIKVQLALDASSAWAGSPQGIQSKENQYHCRTKRQRLPLTWKSQRHHLVSSRCLLCSSRPACRAYCRRNCKGLLEHTRWGAHSAGLGTSGKPYSLGAQFGLSHRVSVSDRAALVSTMV